MSENPTADQAARDPQFRRGNVDIAAHPPAAATGVDRHEARPPTITGKTK